MLLETLLAWHSLARGLKKKHSLGAVRTMDWHLAKEGGFGAAISNSSVTRWPFSLPSRRRRHRDGAADLLLSVDLLFWVFCGDGVCGVEHCEAQNLAAIGRRQGGER